MICRMDFNMVLKFNFCPKVGILHGLYPLHDGRFSKWSHFLNISVFLEWFFAQKNSK